MDLRTVITGRFKTAGLLSAAACLLLIASPASAAIIDTYSDATAFQGAVQSSYLENFDSLPLGQNFDPTLNFTIPLDFTNGAYSYSVDAPGDSIFVINDPNNESNESISTNGEDKNIVFTFAAGINAVGGNFFPSDVNGSAIDGPITILFDDNTTYTLTDPAAFSGFISNVDIASLTVGTGGGTNSFATVDNFIVGSTGPADVTAPEPQSVFLLLGGLSACALRLRRRNA
jgi:hypothetical protein